MGRVFVAGNGNPHGCLANYPQVQTDVTLAIGPVSAFAQEEIEQARAEGRLLDFTAMSASQIIAAAENRPGDQRRYLATITMPGRLAPITRRLVEREHFGQRAKPIPNHLQMIEVEWCLEECKIVEIRVKPCKRA
jgi:hypothetical protein